SLDSLERLVLRSSALQRFVVRAHARAFRQLLPALPPIERVAIVGGGLFPRTYVVLSSLQLQTAQASRVPSSARFTIIDANADNLARARSFLERAARLKPRAPCVSASVELVQARYDPRDAHRYDLVVIPLSFDGDRQSVYAHPPAPAV